ncbi:MAG: 1-acyl-sn-glycerol-3-phosphate acyltransferase [Verrucomicrobiota bacterium]
MKLLCLIIQQLLRWIIRCYYPRIEITGREHIPQNGPVIFVANHANALIDPVLLGIVTRRPVVFLTKAPLFDIPLFGRFLKSLGMIPAYRASDDAKQVRRNHDSVEKAAQALTSGIAIGVFPEGISHDGLHLEKIRSGAARIALKAFVNGTKDLQIVPIGFNFERKEKFRSSIWVQVGKPISLAEWLKTQPEDEGHRIRHLRETINARLCESVIHLEEAEWEPLLDDLEALIPAKFHPGQDPIIGLKRRQWLAEGMNHFNRAERRRARTLAIATLRHHRELDAIGLSPSSPIMRLKGPAFTTLLFWRTITLCAGIIPTVLGTVQHIVPFFLTRWLAHRVSANKRITLAQARLGFGLPVYGAWYAFVWYWGQSYFLPWVATGWTILMPFCGAYALSYWRQVIEAALLWWHQVKALVHREKLKTIRLEQARLGQELLNLGNDFSRDHPVEAPPANQFSWFWLFRRTVRWTVGLSVVGFLFLWLKVLTQNEAFPELTRQGPDLQAMSTTALTDKISADEKALAGILTGLAELEKKAVILNREFLDGKRTFYNQGDDDMVRSLELSLISYRTELLRLLWDYQGHTAIADEHLRLRGFLLMLTSGAALYENSYKFVYMFADDPVIIKKLNEGDPRWNIPNGLYDYVRENLRQPQHQKLLANGFEHYRRFAPLLEAQGLAGIEPYRAFATQIRQTELMLSDAKVGVVQESFLAAVKEAKFLGKAAIYKGQSAVSTWVGDTRVRQPRAGQALIQPRQLIEMRQIAKPGDILIERQNWFLSRAFMPGYWAHAALYVGSVQDLVAMGLDQDPRVKTHWQKFINRDEEGHEYVILEAVPAGVRMTTMEHCMGIADSAAILRPRLNKDQIREAIAVAFSHLGKPYDFEFDFFSTDKLVCTELVYRAYDTDMNFPLVEVMGRRTLPPTEMVRYFADNLNKPDRELDFVAFYDGKENLSHAVESNAEELAKSVNRPALTWLQKK